MPELGIFRFGIYFSFANSFNWMIMLGTPMILLGEKLGASPFQVGLLYSSAFLLLPIQIAATAILPHLGFKMQVLWSWAARSLFVLVPIGISIVGPEEPAPALLTIYIVAVFAFCFFRSIGATALIPWLYTIIPENKQGRYFGTDALVVGIGGIITLVFSSLLFALLPAYDAFTVLFTLTVIASVACVFFISKLPNGERPVVVPISKLLQTAADLCLKAGDFRSYLRLQIIYACVGYAFVPFSIFYLSTELGYSQSYILSLTALQFFGMTATAFVLKEWSDRIGAKPFFLISHAATILFQFAWLILIVFPGTLEPLLPVVYLIVGMAMATFVTSNFKYLPQLCKPEDRAIAVSVYSAVVGLTGGIASTLWGFLLKDSTTGDIDRNWFIFYFALALTFQVFLLYAFIKLRETRSHLDAIPQRGWLVRPFRFMVALIDLVERPKGQSSNLKQ